MQFLSIGFDGRFVPADRLLITDLAEAKERAERGDPASWGPRPTPRRSPLSMPEKSAQEHGFCDAGAAALQAMQPRQRPECP
jgi:hypothetical protein